MRTAIGSFIITSLCSFATTIQSLISIGGFMGLFIGIVPIIAWAIIFPFYVWEKKNDVDA